MELLKEQVAKSVKAAKGKQAKEEAKGMLNQAEEQALESKRRAEEADVAFLEASFAADEAKAEAESRTQKRKNRSLWKDHDVGAPDNGDANAGRSGAADVAATGASMQQLPSGAAPPAYQLIVTILSAQSVNLGSDDSGVHGGRSLVFCVVRVEPWHSAANVTTVRKLPQDQTSPNEVSWRQQDDDVAGDNGEGGGEQVLLQAFSREGLPTAVTIELRRRPLEVGPLCFLRCPAMRY
jgi:hypothetical protein